MSTDILTLAYSLRVASATSSHPIKLSHAQQFVAASLGYGSLAAYQADDEECKQIDDRVHILLNFELLRDRAADLGVPIDHGVLFGLLSAAFRQQLPRASLYTCASDFGDWLTELVQKHVPDNEIVANQTAMTNSDGIREVYFEVQFTLDDLPEVGDYLELPADGHVTMEPDIERPYSGHHVDVKVTVSAERLGRAIFGPATVRVNSAKLDYRWGDQDDEESVVRVTFAQALADELGLDLADAEQLVDVEPGELTGNSGEMVYSIVLDFTDVAPADVAKKIIAKYGTLQIEVLANFFDRVIRGFD